jgi:hypothetical protein
MKYIYIVLILISFISCKKEEPIKKIGWMEYNELRDSLILSSNFTKNKQKLFLNYYVNMNSKDFENLTQKYLNDSIIIKKDSLLLFPIHSNMYKTYEQEYLSVKTIFIKDQLKSIYLTSNNIILDTEKNEQYLFFNYHSILEEKYKKAILESHDDTFDQAFWIKNGTVISLIDNKTDIFIEYEDINFVKNKINVSRNEDIIQEKKISNFKKKELEKEKRKDSLNKNSF